MKRSCTRLNPFSPRQPSRNCNSLEDASALNEAIPVQVYWPAAVGGTWIRPAGVASFEIPPQRLGDGHCCPCMIEATGQSLNSAIAQQIRYITSSS